MEEKAQAFGKALVESHLAPAGGSAGQPVVQKSEMDLRFSLPGDHSLMQEENWLTTEYQKLYASARVPFQGKSLTIAQLGPFYKESTDRATRRAALEAEGGFFRRAPEEFDSLFSQLVKNRTEQAKSWASKALWSWRPAPPAQLLQSWRISPGSGTTWCGSGSSHNVPPSGVAGLPPGDFRFSTLGQRPEVADGSRAPGLSGRNPGCRKKMYAELPETAEFIS